MLALVAGEVAVAAGGGGGGGSFFCGFMKNGCTGFASAVGTTSGFFADTTGLSEVRSTAPGETERTMGDSAASPTAERFVGVEGAAEAGADADLRFFVAGSGAGCTSFFLRDGRDLLRLAEATAGDTSSSSSSITSSATGAALVAAAVGLAAVTTAAFVAACATALCSAAVGAVMGFIAVLGEKNACIIGAAAVAVAAAAVTAAAVTGVGRAMEASRREGGDAATVGGDGKGEARSSSLVSR